MANSKDRRLADKYFIGFEEACDGLVGQRPPSYEEIDIHNSWLIFRNEQRKGLTWLPPWHARQAGQKNAGKGQIGSMLD